MVNHMGQIKAIETEYKGYRFRSRSEARWAVFLDSLSLDWEYEIEGFVLRDGTHYLPDFYVRDWGLWIEIKGAAPTPRELKIFQGFQSEVGEVIILYGRAFQWEHGCVFWDDDTRKTVSWGYCSFARCCRLGWWIGTWDQGIPLVDCKGDRPACKGDRPASVTGDVARAYLAARQARFEHLR